MARQTGTTTTYWTEKAKAEKRARAVDAAVLWAVGLAMAALLVVSLSPPKGGPHDDDRTTPYAARAAQPGTVRGGMR